MPLLPAQLTQPTMGGVVTSTTADMLAQAGARLSQEIEARNVALDAQMRAPVIAKAMGPALEAISKGDFSGFGALAQATAASAGNPFLQAMFKDSDAVGAKLASNYMESQAIKSREGMNLADINSRERIASAHDAVVLAGQDAATARADARQKESEDRADNRFNQQLEREDNQLYLQKQADWERDKATMDANHVKETNRIQEENAAEIRRGQLDPSYQPQLKQLPPKPEYPPEPQRPAPRTAPPAKDTTLGGTVPGSLSDISPDGGLFGTTSDITSLSKQPISAANKAILRDSTPTPQATPAISPFGGDVSPGANSGGTGAPPPAQAAAQPQFRTGTSNAGNVVNDTTPAEAPKPQVGKILVNESAPPVTAPRPPAAKEDTLEAPFGFMTWHIKVPGANKMSIKEEAVKTPTGTVTYKVNGADDEKQKKAARFVEIVGELNAMDYDFAQQASLAMWNGKKVTLSQSGDKKADKWTPMVDGKPMEGPNPAYQTYLDNPNKSASTPVPPQTVTRGEVSGDVAKRWIEAQGLANTLKSSIGITVEPPKAAVDAMKSQAMKRVATGEFTLEQVNDGLKKRGFSPLTKEQVGNFATDNNLVWKDAAEQHLGVEDPRKQADKTRQHEMEVDWFARAVVEREDRIARLKQDYQMSLMKGDKGANYIYDQMVQEQRDLDSALNRVQRDTPDVDVNKMREEARNLIGSGDYQKRDRFNR